MKKFNVGYTDDNTIGKQETIEAMSLEEAVTIFLQEHPEANDWEIELIEE